MIPLPASLQMVHPEDLDDDQGHRLFIKPKSVKSESSLKCWSGEMELQVAKGSLLPLAATRSAST